MPRVAGGIKPKAEKIINRMKNINPNEALVNLGCSNNYAYRLVQAWNDEHDKQFSFSEKGGIAKITEI